MGGQPPGLRPPPAAFWARGKWLAMVALIGCAPPTIAPLLLPLLVDEAIPTDIDRSEVNRDPEGCYFYTFANELFVVRDRNGDPICIPI